MNSIRNEIIFTNTDTSTNNNTDAKNNTQDDKPTNTTSIITNNTSDENGCGIGIRTSISRKTTINKNKCLDDFDKYILNVDLRKEELKHYNFMLEHTYNINPDFIRWANFILDRKIGRSLIDSIVNVINISYDIENGIFEYSINYITQQSMPKEHIIMIYEHKLDDICQNLDITNTHINNKTLLMELYNGNISGQSIPFLKTYQLHPERWKHIIDKNKLKVETLSQVNTTDKYKCTRCGERKHTYYIAQTRSLDEPSTVFFTCTVCKRTFAKSL